MRALTRIVCLVVAVIAALQLAASPQARAQSSSAVTTETTTGSREGVPATTWQTVTGAGGRVKVWAQTRYPGDLQTAQAVASAMTSTIWRTLTRQFWEPLKDTEFTVTFSSGPLTITNHGDTGGGPELDIYLIHYAGNEPFAVDQGGHAHAVDRGRFCGESPRYLTLESRRPLGGASGPGILPTAAHELMHAISQTKQWLNEDCNEFRWIDEATATWAEHAVYKFGQSEQVRAVKYLQTTHLPLNFVASDQDERHYGLYLLPFDLEIQRLGAAIPDMWKKFGTQKSLAGIDAALVAAGSSLEKFFPRFMLDSWNREPVDDYLKLDGLKDGARVDENPRDVALGNPNRIEMPMQIRHVSAEYRYFRFKPEVRTVTFVNDFNGNPHAEVWAIEKVAGVWKTPIPLSKETGRTWCRDIENLEELVLAFGNTAWPKTPAQEGNLTSLILRGKPVIEVFGTGCNAWVGTSSVESTMTAEGITVTETSRAQVRFVPNDDLNTAGQPPEYWKAVSGTIHWTASISGKCTGSGSGTVPIEVDADGNLMGSLQIWDQGDGRDAQDRRILRYGGTMGPWPKGYEPKWTWNCGTSTTDATLLFAHGWWQPDVEGHKIPEGTRVLNDRRDFTAVGVAKVIARWTFRIAP